MALTPGKVAHLEPAGFGDFKFAQKLTCHPVYSDDESEQPIKEFDQRDDIAICGVKK